MAALSRTGAESKAPLSPKGGRGDSSSLMKGGVEGPGPIPGLITGMGWGFWLGRRVLKNADAPVLPGRLPMV